MGVEPSTRQHKAAKKARHHCAQELEHIRREKEPQEKERAQRIYTLKEETVDRPKAINIESSKDVNIELKADALQRKLDKLCAQRQTKK
eukprot:11711694-Ditylum_brightwellii.AAC.1